MARQLEINGRKYWILSEPLDDAWKSKDLEVRDTGDTEELGIDALAETRVAADDAAERKLRRLLEAH